MAENFFLCSLLLLDKPHCSSLAECTGQSKKKTCKQSIPTPRDRHICQLYLFHLQRDAPQPRHQPLHSVVTSAWTELDKVTWVVPRPLQQVRSHPRSVLALPRRQDRTDDLASTLHRRVKPGFTWGGCAALPYNVLSTRSVICVTNYKTMTSVCFSLNYKSFLPSQKVVIPARNNEWQCCRQNLFFP